MLAALGHIVYHVQPTRCRLTTEAFQDIYAHDARLKEPMQLMHGVQCLCCETAVHVL